MPREVAVVGGGIAGLVAARRLAQGGARVTVYEASSVLGGKLSSESFRGRTIDLGPDSFITRLPAATELCRALGLGDDLLAPTSATAAIFSRGELRPFPSGLVLGIPTDTRALRASGIVSSSAVLRCLVDRTGLFGRLDKDPAGSARSGGPDPTVAEVVGRRLGTSVLFMLADPLIGGINASDVSALSFYSAAPQLALAAAGRRSLMRGLSSIAASGRSAVSGPAFYGLRRGLSSLVEALVEDLERAGVELATGAELEQVVRDPSKKTGYFLRVGGETRRFEGVVLALPAHRAAPVVSELDDALALECAAVPFSSVATVTVAFNASAVPAALRERFSIAKRSPRATEPLVPGALPGNGVLVPRGDGRLVTALTFTSTKWPRSANPGEVVVRASLGRHRDERALKMDDPELLAAVRRDLFLVVGIEEAPLSHRIVRFVDSFPQYVSGHAARVERIEALAHEHPGLALCGASYHGIGIPACVASGERAAEAVLGASS